MRTSESRKSSSKRKCSKKFNAKNSSTSKQCKHNLIQKQSHFADVKDQKHRGEETVPIKTYEVKPISDRKNDSNLELVQTSTQPHQRKTAKRPSQPKINAHRPQRNSKTNRKITQTIK